MRTAKVDTEAPEEVDGRKVQDDACIQVDADALENAQPMLRTMCAARLMPKCSRRVPSADAQDDARNQIGAEVLEAGPCTRSG